MTTSAGSGGQGPQIKRPPSPLIWKALVVIGILARIVGEGQASEARARAEGAASRVAAGKARQADEQARLADSTRLAAAVDSGTALSAERVWQLDWTLHSARFVIPHDSMHRRVVGLQLDSAGKVIRRAAKDLTYATAARQLLAAVQAPLTPSQTRREVELSGQMRRIDRRLAVEASRREARARALAESQRALQPTRPRTRIERPSNRVPAGASARCRDGSYSYSASRRATCSHHGGVAEWL
jgi:hypothetical protein